MTSTGPAASATVGRREAREWVAAAEELLRDVQWLGDVPQQLAMPVQQEYTELHQALVRQRLEQMPVGELTAFSPGLRGTKALSDSDYSTVWAVLDAGVHRLQNVRNVAQRTAVAVMAAAEQAAASISDETVVRLDASQASSEHTMLLRGLRTLIMGVRTVAGVDEARQRLLDRLPSTIADARPGGSRLRRLFADEAAKKADQQALHRLEALLAGPDTAAVDTALADIRTVQEQARTATDAEVWDDYVHAAAVYQTLLAMVRGETAAGAAQTGHVPQAVADAVGRITLDVTLLKVRLRAYQVFGAQYVLSRQGSILGDEMGLGKTVEAIAVIAHLTRLGRRTCLIVVPASVLHNWLTEFEVHSQLTAMKIHGPDRQETLQSWFAGGGIAVTTYRMLRTFSLPPTFRVDLLIVDEAHRIKNPAAQQSQHVAALTHHADRVVLLTGTPMENRLSEFRNLVRYLDFELAYALVPRDNGFVDPLHFRERVAQVYLRRNQEDVLQELPELVEENDLVELNTAEAGVYADAVARRHFPDMRRAAYAHVGSVTAKIDRLRDIVAESAADGRKVVIFSQFLDVITTISTALVKSPQMVLTGSTPAGRRQEAIDRFTAHEGHFVLIGQIQAIGEGINLQAASVVVLAEPALKPSTEEQAIRRVYRMGQARSVQVHRLLAKDSVDDYLEAILHDKRKLFRAYAHDSDAKRTHSSATDPSVVDYEVSDVDRERIIDAETQRLTDDRQRRSSRHTD
jgi:superfamily II DNA or RNA helicase